MMSLTGKKVLVTGATGFVGGRLVERLLLEEGASVRALVSHFGRAAWLSRTQAEMVSGNVTDEQSLRRAVDGCEVVFHCAAAMGGDARTMHQVNVLGTENVIKASLAVSSAKVIHVSSMAVYGRRLPDGLDETHPPNPGDDVYGQTKLAAEQIVMRYHRECGLPVVILQPTIVYGPRSQWWTVDPINRIKRGQLAILGKGEGIANIVYVDDVVTAMILAAKSDGVVGETLLVSSEETVTWADFFGAYVRMSKMEIPTWSPLRAQLCSSLTGYLDSSIATLRDNDDSSNSAKLGLLVMLLAVRKCSRPLYKLGRWEVDMYSQGARVNVSRAKEVLGYRSEYPLSKGMKETEAWLRAQGYLTA